MSTAQTITVKQAAALFGRSERWVHGLREAGWITTEGRGAYPLVGLVRGVLAYFEDQVTKGAEAAKAATATDARTREIELKIDARRRELVAADGVAAVITEFEAMALAEFNRLPGRFTKRPADRAHLRGEIGASVTRIAAARDRALSSLKKD
jgi:hypothetical protein